MPHHPDRRDFVAGIAAVPLAARAQTVDAPRRAVIIGHTGRGDWGHGLDRIFEGRAGLRLCAVADADPAGRERARQRTGAERAYADYREMLRAERPDLVCVAPRCADQHAAMLLAALEAGAHVFCEKPLVRSPDEADAVLAAARARQRRIAVAHQMRVHPAVTALHAAFARGEFGELVTLTGWGKQDQRAGGEDLMVLGVHVFDLMRLFAGDPLWCTASVLAGGRAITQRDARLTKDDVGLVAGDEVEAQFAFAGGVWGTFTSRARLRDQSGWWGLELVGSRGRARILADIPPRVRVLSTTGWQATPRVDQWQLPPGTTDEPADAGAFARANARVVDDWLAAIDQNREPACSGAAGARAVEMVAAVYRAALTERRVALPPAERGHPLRPDEPNAQLGR
ncbi:MAG: Gfo/Idh/MocA family oxidoreductase [Armatimonadetes bacterium]|nr:Gfo/Idh/MocA family oxidoreductase [Armatimonadota bacterium]